jgi:hypothetical protein
MFQNDSDNIERSVTHNKISKSVHKNICPETFPLSVTGQNVNVSGLILIHKQELTTSVPSDPPICEHSIHRLSTGWLSGAVECARWMPDIAACEARGLLLFQQQSLWRPCPPRDQPFDTHILLLYELRGCKSGHVFIWQFLSVLLRRKLH